MVRGTAGGHGVAAMNSVRLWLSREHACSYLEDRVAASAVVDPDLRLNKTLYSALIDQGFRRSGDQAYRPHCPQCQACIATRIPVDRFRPDRSQRRCLQQHADTRVEIKPAQFDAGHFELYRRYQAGRHDPEGGQAITADEYLQFLGSSWCDTRFVEFHFAGRLAAVAVVDIVRRGLSAVYTFYDPELTAYSPGVLAVLWQIGHAAELGLEYLYLGYWIGACRKMRYKIRYQPLEGFIDGRWQPLTPDFNHSNP